MHCRLSYPTNNSTCSSFLFSQPKYPDTLKHRTCSPSSYHDQKPVLKHRRRLEDPIINHASNYYVTHPDQTSSSTLQTCSISSSHRHDRKIEDKNIYCDLFNLLERPLPIKQNKKNSLNDSNSCRNHHQHQHRAIVYKNIHAKIQDNNERKRYYPQQPLCDKESKHHHQRHLPSKGFFRRVVRNYFCMPMTVTNREFTN